VKPLRFHRAAQAEIRAIAEHYAAIHPGLGLQFYNAMDELVREVRTRPALFRVFDPPARRHFGPRFPYAIVYLDLPDRVWIVAVMHFKQRPGYWAERLE
jgi:plasmid stabilization system protein ParE